VNFAQNIKQLSEDKNGKNRFLASIVQDTINQENHEYTLQITERDSQRLISKKFSINYLT
jgi:hypothetical protein